MDWRPIQGGVEILLVLYLLPDKRNGKLIRRAGNNFTTRRQIKNARMYILITKHSEVSMKTPRANILAVQSQAWLIKTF